MNCCRCLIGVDLVEAVRFIHWVHKPLRSLQRVFSPEEIDYCRLIPQQAPERFAGRFACREAIYKALAPLQRAPRVPFLGLCRALTITTTSQGLVTSIDGRFLQEWYGTAFVQLNISLTHTTSLALAVATVHCSDFSQ